MLISEFIPHVSTTIDAQCSLLHRLSTLGIVYAKLPVQELRELALPIPACDTTSQNALTLKTSLLNGRILLGPFSIDMIESIVMWLDQGINKILINAESSNKIEQVAVAMSDIPVNRVVLRIPVSSYFNTTQIMELTEKLGTLASGVVFVIESLTLTSDNGAEAWFRSLETLRKSFDEEFFVAVEISTGLLVEYNEEVAFDRIKRLHDKNIHVAALGYCYGVGENTTEVMVEDGQVAVNAVLSFVQNLRTDRPDGLFTTVVADEAGVALGLVYSSAESIVAAVESGCGVYFSRSRNGLWKKGESSGNVQKLIHIDVDCDSDALRFTVNQTGAGFCHLNTRTCWGHDSGLRALERMLFSRYMHAPAGSYTKRLFDDAELLRNKLVEEAQELAEATSVSDVAGEAADVMYFAMVRCVAAGCKLSDVEKMLDKRALKVKRRPGNAKTYRISAANKILTRKDMDSSC